MQSLWPPGLPQPSSVHGKKASEIYLGRQLYIETAPNFLNLVPPNLLMFFLLKMHKSLILFNAILVFKVTT